MNVCRCSILMYSLKKILLFGNFEKTLFSDLAVAFLCQNDYDVTSSLPVLFEWIETLGWSGDISSLRHSPPPSMRQLSSIAMSSPSLFRHQWRRRSWPGRCYPHWPTLGFRFVPIVCDALRGWGPLLLRKAGGLFLKGYSRFLRIMNSRFQCCRSEKMIMFENEERKKVFFLSNSFCDFYIINYILNICRHVISKVSKV